MNVNINGTADDIPAGSSIKSILQSRKIPENIAIIALNGEVISKDKWDEQELREKDSLEIIRVIGGG